MIWVSPEGKIYYHRKHIEADLGRKLTILDGFAGLMQRVQSVIKPDTDKRFLDAMLTKEERKHIALAEEFLFCIVSARRADKPETQHDLMTVEAHFRNIGINPMWYVDAASLESYKALGLNAIVGGKLTPARNMGLDIAEDTKKVCVQVSDDISLWEYYNIKQTSGCSDFTKCFCISGNSCSEV